MWQQCPNCKGLGTSYYPLSHSTSAVCTVCKGHKIINELTGLPPSSEPIRITTSNTAGLFGDDKKQVSTIEIHEAMFKDSK